MPTNTETQSSCGNDLFKLTPTVIYKHCRSLISCELRSITLVLLEMISVRDGAFCLHQFDDDLVKSLIESICIVTSFFFLLFILCTISVRYYNKYKPLPVVVKVR